MEILWVRRKKEYCDVTDGLYISFQLTCILNILYQQSNDVKKMVPIARVTAYVIVAQYMCFRDLIYVTTTGK